MFSYPLYFLIAVGLSVLITVAFRKLREGKQDVAHLRDDVAFHRRMAEIEKRLAQSSSEEEDDKVVR